MELVTHAPPINWKIKHFQCQPSFIMTHKEVNNKIINSISPDTFRMAVYFCFFFEL